MDSAAVTSFSLAPDYQLIASPQQSITEANRLLQVIKTRIASLNYPQCTDLEKAIGKTMGFIDSAQSTLQENQVEEMAALKEAENQSLELLEQFETKAAALRAKQAQKQAVNGRQEQVNLAKTNSHVPVKASIAPKIINNRDSQVQNEIKAILSSLVRKIKKIKKQKQETQVENTAAIDTLAMELVPIDLRTRITTAANRQEYQFNLDVKDQITQAKELLSGLTLTNTSNSIQDETKAAT